MSGMSGDVLEHPASNSAGMTLAGLNYTVAMAFDIHRRMMAMAISIIRMW